MVTRREGRMAVWKINVCAILEGRGFQIELTFTKRQLSVSCFLLPLSHFREGKIEAWRSCTMYSGKWWSTGHYYSWETLWGRRVVYKVGRFKRKRPTAKNKL